MKDSTYLIIGYGLVKFFVGVVIFILCIRYYQVSDELANTKAALKSMEAVIERLHETSNDSATNSEYREGVLALPDEDELYSVQEYPHTVTR